MKVKWLLSILTAVLFIGTYTSVCEAKEDVPDYREQLAYSLGIQAYIYGYPLVVMQQTEDNMLRTRAPINQFYYSEKLASPAYKDIVTPNSSTLYFTAWLDLSRSSVVLNVPDNGSGRYYTVQMLDAYTNTFQNVSNRSTKDKAGKYIIVGPEWRGEGSGHKVKAPTNTVWIIGRVEMEGKKDLHNTVAFEKQFTLTSLQRDTQKPLIMEPSKVNKVDEQPLAFYKTMTEQLQHNPPPACDHVLLDQFKWIGIDINKGFNAKNLDAATITGLIRAAADAQRIIEKASKRIPTDNGWAIGYGIGTYGDQFLLRAIVAYSGLGANVPSEELYARAFVDGSDKPLNGANRYVLHFKKEQIPQVYGLWSLTMYGSDFYLVPNTIQRYSIGNLTKGLQYNADGSLDIFLQQFSPKGKVSNWLPAPAGDFNLVLRMFAPKPAMLNGSYKVPPVVQVN